jgi:hypothetical protein
MIVRLNIDFIALRRVMLDSRGRISAFKVMSCTLRQDPRRLSRTFVCRDKLSLSISLLWLARLHVSSRTQPPLGPSGHLIVSLEMPTKAWSQFPLCFFNILVSIVCDQKIEHTCSTTCKIPLSLSLSVASHNARAALDKIRRQDRHV